MKIILLVLRQERHLQNFEAVKLPTIGKTQKLIAAEIYKFTVMLKKDTANKSRNFYIFRPVDSELFK